MRAPRDLLRRRTHLMRKRAALLAPGQNTNAHDHPPAIGKKIADKANREGVAHRFTAIAGHKAIEVDLALLTDYDALLSDLARYLRKTAKHHAANPLSLLQTGPGIGKLLSLVLRYEIHDIDRFPRVQDFVSYGRLVTGANESAGKRLGTSGKNIGTAHLKWAFSEAAALLLRNHEPGQK